MDGWDIITTPLNDVRRIGGFSNLKQHWDADEHLRLNDLRHMYDILCERHPDYKTDADAVLNGRTAAFCNMFIMRKEIFFEYNEWLFPLLDGFAMTTDFSKMDMQTTRAVGHLSERLLNIFTRIQFVSATPVFGWLVFDITLPSSRYQTSLGVSQPRTFMGVSLISSTMACRSSSVRSSKPVLLGR